MSKRDTARSKRTLYLLLIVFVIPVLLAQLLFRFQDRFTFRTIEKGILLEHPILLSVYPHCELEFSEKWQIVHVGNSRYQISQQEDKLPLLQQIHAAIGKEAYRVGYHSIPSEKMPYLTSGDIGIVDPEGWLIMYYIEDTDPQNIVKDMRRLLRIGHG